MNPAEHRKELTARIIRQLEEGTAPWVKPWEPGAVHAGLPFNGVSARPYHGGNLVWLDMQGYADPRWCTYRQAAEQGWQVRKGEKSTTVEYWQWTERKRDAEGKMVEVQLEVPRVFYAAVFNVQQMNNVPEHRPSAPSWAPEDAAEVIIQNSGAQILHLARDRAYYQPKLDSIHLPPRAQFPTSMAYYGTILHELGHWSGHESRLNRDLTHSFGSEGYAREELRAELASYFLSARMGIPHDPSQHASYIASWIEALRQDHNEIFRAAKDAEKICDFVMQFQHEREKQGAPTTSTLAGSLQQEEELEC